VSNQSEYIKSEKSNTTVGPYIYDTSPSGVGESTADGPSGADSPSFSGASNAIDPSNAADPTSVDDVSACTVASSPGEPPIPVVSAGDSDRSNRDEIPHRAEILKTADATNE
jgi:hypothetical protein